MDGYETCCLYRALKLHFTTKYDFHKYLGRTKYTQEHFEGNKHKYSYIKLSKKYSNTELKDFFIANFIHSSNVWIQDLLEQEAHENFIKFSRRKQALFYTFDSDLINIFSEHDYKSLVVPKSDKEFPLLLTKLMRNEVCVETVIISNRFCKFIQKWETVIKDDIIWPHINRMLLKYEPFVEYDKKKFKDALIQRIDEFK